MLDFRPCSFNFLFQELEEGAKLFLVPWLVSVEMALDVTEKVTAFLHQKGLSVIFVGWRKLISSSSISRLFVNKDAVNWGSLKYISRTA